MLNREFMIINLEIYCFIMVLTATHPVANAAFQLYQNVSEILRNTGYHMGSYLLTRGTNEVAPIVPLIMFLLLRDQELMTKFVLDSSTPEELFIRRHSFNFIHCSRHMC